MRSRNDCHDSLGRKSWAPARFAPQRCTSESRRVSLRLLDRGLGIQTTAEPNPKSNVWLTGARCSPQRRVNEDMFVEIRSRLVKGTRQATVESVACAFSSGL